MPAAAKDVTMVKKGIHNPADARHFMRLGEPTYLITANLQGLELAHSQQALKLKEVGFDIYDPIIYFPRADVAMEHLIKNAKTTHCPLKGDTEYFDAQTPDGRIENVAWSYDRTIERATALTGYIGFDSRLVQIIEYTTQT